MRSFKKELWSSDLHILKALQSGHMDDDDHFSEIVERSPIQGHDNLIISWLENVHFQSPKKMLKIIIGGRTGWASVGLKFFRPGPGHNLPKN